MNETQVILPITDPNRPDFAWLNEDSKLFLQRGYLLEGTSALERIRFIAEYAEQNWALKVMQKILSLHGARLLLAFFTNLVEFRFGSRAKY
ncbi:Uncharacterised protein [Aggregatibacter aphrophilus]|uniref:Uncharacterized protein n=1 Tax=Aggregatibacter aphrophilus TaxID=732 RepID=A0A336N577_AGGAP|nr:Uncharacterised protein [Aggregatibacter aphrophilus]